MEDVDLAIPELEDEQRNLLKAVGGLNGSLQHLTERPNWSFNSYIRWHSLRRTEKTVLFRFKWLQLGEIGPPGEVLSDQLIRCCIDQHGFSECMVRRRVASGKMSLAVGLRQCIRPLVESKTPGLDGYPLAFAPINWTDW